MKVEVTTIIIHITSFIFINQFSSSKPKYQMSNFESYSAFAKFMLLNFDFFLANL
jgi:hypothetical protein